MKKTLTALLLVFALLFACGCSDGGKKSENENQGEGEKPALTPVDELPSFTDDGSYEYWIAGWNGPSTSEYDKAFKVMADAGFNHMPLSSSLMSSGTMVNYLDYAEKYGIKVYPQMMGRVTVPPEEYFVNVFDDYLDHKGLGGFYYFDEPASGLYDKFTVLAKNHAEKYSPHGLDFIINLYGITYYDDPSLDNRSSSYLEYVMQYCNAVFPYVDGLKFLSVDHYPLCYTGSADNISGYYLEPEWLISCETVAECAKSWDAFPHFFLLSTGHYNKYRDATEERLRYQANVYMAYGARGLSHFTSHGNKDADPNSNRFNVDSMISADGCTTRPTYEYAKKVNLEILSWDHVFLRYDWQGVQYVLGEGNDGNTLFSKTQFGLASLPGVEFLSSTEDLIVGHFTDENSQPAYMVTNFVDPDVGTQDDTATVNMVITDANRAIVYRNGVPETVEVKDGALTLEVGVGEAAFVIPVNLKNG